MFINTLTTCNSLLHLNLSNCQLDVNQCMLLSSFITTSQVIQSLNLSHNYLGKHMLIKLSHNKQDDDNDEANEIYQYCPALTYLCTSLSNTTSLVTINLSDNLIDYHGINKLCQVIPLFTSIKVVNLSENYLNEAALFQLSQSMKQNKSSLSNLIISANKCTMIDYTLISLTYHIQVYNFHLTSLDLSYNTLNDQIINNLLAIPHLSSLNLSFCCYQNSNTQIQQHFINYFLIQPVVATTASISNNDSHSISHSISISNSISHSISISNSISHSISK